MAQIWNMLATTRLIAEAFLKVHATVGLLSLPVRGARQVEGVHTSRKVASCRTNTDKSRSELVICPLGLSKLIRLAQMPGGHWRRHTKFVPPLLVSNQTPPHT